MIDVITFVSLLGYILFTIKSLQDEGLFFTVLSQVITITFVYALLGGH